MEDLQWPHGLWGRPQPLRVPGPPSHAQLPPSPQWGTAPSQYPPPIGAGQGLASLRRAFAGKGRLILHHSWLLDGKEVEATAVGSTIMNVLQLRNIPGLSINPERL